MHKAKERILWAGLLVVSLIIWLLAILIALRE